jgi:hypothetical protein
MNSTKKKRFILDPGIMECKFLLTEFNNFDLTLISDGPLNSSWAEVSNACSNHLYESFKSPNLRSGESIEGAFEAYQYIIEDHRTLLIAERITPVYYFRSAHNLLKDIFNYVENFFSLFNSVKPEFIFFQATPHNLGPWILAKLAEFFKIDIYFIQTSPLVWRYWVVKGLDKQKPFFPFEGLKAKEVSNSIEVEQIQRYCDILNGEYKEALPSYESKRLDERNNKIWSWKTEFKNALKDPKQFIVLLKKRRLFSYYIKKSHDLNVLNNFSYCIFYQPERTSLPESKWFSQQWILIKLISNLLPQNTKLFVKEHPSTFTGKYDYRYRENSFYEAISQLPNVNIVPLEYDSFKLIDNAKCSITLTGTVGMQSLIRGTPVVFFGNAAYKYAPGAYSPSESLSKSLLCVFETVFNNEYVFPKEEFESYLKNLLNLTEQTNIIHDNFDFYSVTNRITGNSELLFKFLKYYYEN